MYGVPLVRLEVPVPLQLVSVLSTSPHMTLVTLVPVRLAPAVFTCVTSSLTQNGK